jgi:spore coat polysaccharide biosynthesis protein SpsF
MIGCIVQARMGSSRLPGKVMMKIDDKNPIIHYVLEQLKHCNFLDEIIVATTVLKEDDVIENFVRKNDFKCFRGSEQDVLDRYYQCAKNYSLSAVVRITSDNPLVDPDIIDKIVTLFKTNDYDYVSNEQPPTFPLGYAVEVFSFSALEIAWKKAELPSEREHVTPYFYKNKEVFKQINFGNSIDLSNIRCTLDTNDDYNLIKKIMHKINHRPILLNDVLKLFEKEPELSQINKHVKHDGYLRSLKSDEKFLKSKLKK